MTEARKLSPRLARILDLLKPCRCLADIGSDHGYLICQAVLDGKAARGVAVEMNDDPYQQTILAVVEAFLIEEISVRKGNGLDPVHVGEANAVCIAGMGGKTIAEILTLGSPKLSAVSQLVLQPNLDAHIVRRCLRDLGFVVEDETLVADGAFIYQIISAVPGASGATGCGLDSIYLEYGAVNLLRGDQLLRELLTRDMVHLEKVAAQMSQAKSKHTVQRRHEVLARIAQLQARLANTTTP